MESTSLHNQHHEAFNQKSFFFLPTSKQKSRRFIVGSPLSPLLKWQSRTFQKLSHLDGTKNFARKGA